MDSLFSFSFLFFFFGHASWLAGFYLIYLFIYLFIFACRILVPQPGIEPRPWQ